LHGESDSLVKRLLEPARPRVTGLYIPVDHFCGAFFRALREAGKKPGRDIEAVLGNYNPVIYHNLDHSPAAIDINLPMLVRKVVDHLLWRIENPEVNGRIGVTVSPRLLTPDRQRCETAGQIISPFQSTEPGSSLFKVRKLQTTNTHETTPAYPRQSGQPSSGLRSGCTADGQPCLRAIG
jgi:hypothetical protein